MENKRTKQLNRLGCKCCNKTSHKSGRFTFISWFRFTKWTNPQGETRKVSINNRRWRRARCKTSVYLAEVEEQKKEQREKLKQAKEELNRINAQINDCNEQKLDSKISQSNQELEKAKARLDKANQDLEKVASSILQKLFQPSFSYQ